MEDKKMKNIKLPWEATHGYPAPVVLCNIKNKETGEIVDCVEIEVYCSDCDIERKFMEGWYTLKVILDKDDRISFYEDMLNEPTPKFDISTATGAYICEFENI